MARCSKLRIRSSEAGRLGERPWRPCYLRIGDRDRSAIELKVLEFTRSMSSQNLADFEPLMPSEKGLLANIGSGIFHRCGDGRLPAVGDASCHIRAELLRLILLGGHGLPPIHEKGLLVLGAWVTGILDLEGCRISRDLRLADCRFNAAPMLSVPCNCPFWALSLIIRQGAPLKAPCHPI